MKHRSSRAAAPKRRGKAGYVLGIDFGTLSARALVVAVADGAEIAHAVAPYRHGVIDRSLPETSKRLPPDTALQDPADYLEAMRRSVRQALRSAGIRPEQVAGIGTDFTSCTMLPVRKDGTPLAGQKRWRSNPHAWVKLWKHHAAQPEADAINALAAQRNEPFLRSFGGRYSSEWFFSKLLETVRHAPAVYRAADRFLEAGDWIVWQLTGVESRSISAAGFKALCVHDASGGVIKGGGAPCFPSSAFFRELHPSLEQVATEKLIAPALAPGECAGHLTPVMARQLGLPAGIPVAVGNIDAHVAAPACAVTGPGKLVMILGTSTCHILISEQRREVEGICGVVRDGVVRGAWGYEAGQASVGDALSWFVENAVPDAAQGAARRDGKNIYQWLEMEAARLAPGESGLIALDWWNGCRSVLMDANLSGLLLGATVTTQPYEIFRALIEATAFGTRKIIEAFERGGIPVRQLHACGGLAKNELLLQIYADVTQRPIRVAASEQTCALGAAMHGAVAAGLYPDIQSAARKMARLQARQFRPRRAVAKTYDRLYALYSDLHDHFGRTPNGPMHRLKQLRHEALQHA